jgi:hypothetical protein
VIGGAREGRPAYGWTLLALKIEVCMTGCGRVHLSVWQTRAGFKRKGPTDWNDRPAAACSRPALSFDVRGIGFVG